jgi:hypothetical protein
MTSPSVRHESSDVSFGSVVGFGAVLVVSAVVISLLVWALFFYLSLRADRRGSTVGRLTQELPQPLPPPPRLQTDPRADLLALRKGEELELSTYGWVDRSAGIVRIPIERAMRLTVDRGLPSRTAKEPGR